MLSNHIGHFLKTIWGLLRLHHCYGEAKVSIAREILWRVMKKIINVIPDTAFRRLPWLFRFLDREWITDPTHIIIAAPLIAVIICISARR